MMASLRVREQSVAMRAMVMVLSSTVAVAALAAPARAQQLPEIRLTERNLVPACVTPPRLMRFLTDRNPNLPPKFRTIAAYYKEHGERNRVRWDYAFYQMLIETNYLIFKNAAGQGDVSPNQNNFAGIGTTGGGVPGDSFSTVSAGVLGQMQHLMAYSGERVDDPVATRTREKQDDIISLSRRLGRPPTFRDLAGRWAVDRRYARSISFIADLYKRRFCSGPLREPEPEGLPPTPEVVAQAGRSRSGAGLGRPSGLGNPSDRRVATLVSPPALATRPKVTCKVFTASYGGKKNVLIRHRAGDELHYTALQVLDGREQGLVDAFIKSHAKGGEAVGEYASRDDALTGAFNRCPASSGTAAARNG